MSASIHDELRFPGDATYDLPARRRLHVHDPGEQSEGPGDGGGDLGYGGIGNSVAIKFDYYNNAGEGDDSTGLFTDGADPYVPAIDLTGTGVNISSGDPMNVTMNYNGSTLNVTITDLDTFASASQSYSVNIPSIVGSPTAYVGFTGGTGGLTSIPAILNWTYTPGQTISRHRKFEFDQRLRRHHLGLVLRRGRAAPRDQLQPGRDPGRRLHPPWQFLRQSPAAQRRGGRPGRDPQGFGGLCMSSMTSSIAPTNPIYPTDPTTGNFTGPLDSAARQPASTIRSARTWPTTAPTLYYNDGYGFGNNEIYEIDAAAARSSIPSCPQEPYYLWGIAYLNGNLWATRLGQHL